MMPPSSGPPLISLEQCIHTLKQHLSYPPSNPKDHATLYLASIAFLCHLKADQATLRQTSQRESDAPTPYPPPQQIPAITAVLQDPRLFHALLACLKLTTDVGDGPDNHIPPLQAPGARYSRKRTFSFQVDAETSKQMKLQHSPVMVKKPALIHKVSSMALATSGDATPTLNGATTEGSKKIDLPIRVVAVTILYSSFQHLDHWPAPLLQAYADDCFGPRLWVDDERCVLLVQNLAMAHQEKGDTDEHMEEEQDECVLKQAEQVAHFYATMEIPPDTHKVVSSPAVAPPPRHERTYSMSSMGRPRTMSVESIDFLAEVQLQSDSDSGHEECLISTGSLVRAGNGDDDGDSSSSGEEDEEVVIMTDAIPSSSSELQEPIESTPKSSKFPPYPITPALLKFQTVRNRYFGVNLEHAHQAIASSLADRLDAKSKQNSRLLQTLPFFMPVPAVRSMTARHLERWLQSPGLSGAARTLFSALVHQMSSVDPPLPEDLEAIDSILGMRLKANQLSVHIENVTGIAKRINSVTIATHIFLRLLREELSLLDSVTGQSTHSEHRQMIAAVHGAVPPSLSADGLAMALLTLLTDLTTTNDSAKNGSSRRERHQQVYKIRTLIRGVASTLGPNYNGCGLVESLLSFDVQSESWTLRDEEDKARLIFECVTLLVPQPSNKEPGLRQKNQRKHHGDFEELREEQIAAVHRHLMMVRKLLINWCCTEYAPLWQAEQSMQDLHHKIVQRTLKGRQADEPIGAGPPNYGSVLDTQQDPAKESLCPNAIRCVLFTVDPDSTAMQEFLYPDSSPDVADPMWQEERYRIQQCCEYGADLDNEMLWTILKSAASDDGINRQMALSLLEGLFECCNKDRTASLRLTDPKLVWSLYDLVEYAPSIPAYNTKSESEAAQSTSDENGSADETTRNGRKIPRLAFPGMWWRATALALVMCGSSPEAIGANMWTEHPTLNALIKMVTSGRYRFPTVDCDEDQRETMKTAESNLRDEESHVTEILFLPPLPKVKPNSGGSEDGVASSYGGSRVSARQREKQAKLVNQQLEKEATEAAAVAARRKKLLRTAQKSVMLWDPRGPARKPPRESVNLILSVEELFCLAEAFQQSTIPDFLLLTIGKTTRGAIERAYDWVIPIISSVPKIISRLPASASCFLLLRAYGTEGEEKSELRKLASPLLEHVSDSLTGAFGQSDATRAADLLLADMADPSSDRRRCARRVLHEALGRLHNTSLDTAENDSTGLLRLLQVEHAPAMVSDCIRCISQGLSFERGKVLRSLIMALDKYIAFGSDHNLGSWEFASILCGLISSRQNVWSEAMDRFPDLHSLAIRLVHQEFTKSIQLPFDGIVSSTEPLVRVRPCSHVHSSGNKDVTLSITLLRSICVLLSIWKDTNLTTVDVASKEAIDEMTNILMLPTDTQKANRANVDDSEGAASATLQKTGKRAVSVDQWVMLAKSRSDVIARRAAMSAPTLFLPRLLLCSGLPRSSLLTMVDRLGRLGDRSQDRDKAFKELLMPSATNEWDIWHIGNRREIARKLVGRLSAYLRSNSDTLDVDQGDMSSTFLKWLSQESITQERPRSARSKKGLKSGHGSASGDVFSLTSTSSILSSISEFDSRDEQEPTSNQNPSVSMELFGVTLKAKPPLLSPDIAQPDAVRSFVMKCFDENELELLKSWLHQNYSFVVSSSPLETSSEVVRKSRAHSPHLELCRVLLEKLMDDSEINHVHQRDLILQWVPLLSKFSGSPDLWESVFSSRLRGSTASQLMTQCIFVWNEEHVASCQNWILSKPQKANGDSQVCVQSQVRFLLLSSGQRSVHILPFANQSPRSDEFCYATHEMLNGVVPIALECARRHPTERIDARNDVPDWLILLLLVARHSKKSMKLVCDALLQAVEQVDDASNTCTAVRSAVLRLYAYFPHIMNLGDPKLRSVLMEAARSVDWIDWRSPLDAQLEAMLTSLQSNPHQRLVQSLIDLSKGHPLLMLRKLSLMVEFLDEDAGVSRCTNGRGRSQAENILGSLEAKLPDTTIKVAIRHWGYSFAEPLWLSFIDILQAMPRELLFGCGMRMGLRDLFGIYAKLLFIQCQLQNKATRLKAKFADFLTAFEQSDASAWENWLASKQAGLLSLGNTRNILMSCSLISASKAIDSVRNNAGDKVLK